MSEDAEAKVPSNLFGVADFFAILMPGGLVAFLLKDWGLALFGTVLPGIEGSLAHWIAFAVAAYFLGHLLHHAGAILDLFYDKKFKEYKKATDDKKLLAYAKELIKDRHKTKNDAEIDVEAISNFSWATSYVKVRSAAGAKELERSGADSKFFRSLCLAGLLAAVLFGVRGSCWPPFAAEAALLVLCWWGFPNKPEKVFFPVCVAALALLLWLGIQMHCAAQVVSVILSIFSLWRFCDLRWKTSELTYEYFIILSELEPNALPDPDHK